MVEWRTRRHEIADVFEHRPVGACVVRLPGVFTMPAIDCCLQRDPRLEQVGVAL